MQVEIDQNLYKLVRKAVLVSARGTQKQVGITHCLLIVGISYVVGIGGIYRS